MAKRRSAVRKRRVPRQRRASDTVEIILEAAAQVLEAGGLPAFTTNAVAQRAGVSIGTLYQYFANKDVLIVALARQEVRNALQSVGRAMQGDPELGTADLGTGVEGRVRAMVRAAIHAFRGRQRARKAVLEAVLSQGHHAELMLPVVAFIAQNRGGAAPQAVFATMTPIQMFVMSRAVIGVLRAAVLEEQPFFKSRPYEDELVRLVLAYVGSITKEAAAP